MKEFFEKLLAFVLAILSALGIGLKTPETPAVTLSGTDTYSIDGDTVTFALASNPTTGYSWTAKQEGNLLEQTETRYEGEPAPKGEVAVAGRGGTEFFVYKAVAAGKATLTFSYERPWEQEDPIKTYVVQITVGNDLKITDVTVVK